ncbi:MAG TPA: sulfite exporter TauE/SafE family protein [Alphaproteobacteria bacterium]
MISDPLFYALAIPAFLITGISKGGFGSGLGPVATLLLALVIPVPQAAAIMLPLLITMDVVSLWSYWGIWDRRNISIMLPGAAIGLVLGYLSFRYLDEGWIRLLVGLIAIGFVANAWLRRYLAQKPAGPSWPKGMFWSCISGLTSFVANAGGPPISVYLVPQRLDKTLYVGTTVLYFALVNAAKIAPFWHLGQFTDENVLTALVLLPLAPVGVRLGIWLHARIDDTAFYRWIYAIMLLSGAKLIWDGVARVF